MAIGALWSRVTGAIVGFAVGQAAADATRPVFEGVRQESWEARAVRVLPVDTLAQLVTNAITSEGAAAEHARRSGYDANKLAALVQLALRAPAIEELLQLRRRDKVSEAQFTHALRKAGLEPQYDDAVRALVEVLPSPQDMVHFAVRETYTPDVAAEFGQYEDFPEQFAQDAELVGLTRERARQYWASHWDLPSPTQGFDMFHRGLITRAQLVKLLRALDVMPFWRDRLIGLAERLPTLPDMIRFAVREVYTQAIVDRFGLGDEYPAIFTEQAALHGLSEVNAKRYWAAHWELPSITQGFHMRHREAIDDVELNLLLRVKDVMPFWRDKLRTITYLVPGRVDLRRMFRAGVLTREEVKRGYRHLGYAEPNAEILTQFAEVEKEDAATRGSLLPLYRRRVVAAAHREYTARQITAADARAAVVAAGVPGQKFDALLPLWNLERDLKRRELTEADIRAAWKADQYTDAEAVAELIERGMTDADARKYLEAG